MLNPTLKQAYEEIGNIQSSLKARVKQIMGWRADAAFYDRVNGRVKCTQAEQAAFSQAFAELNLNIPDDLFPEGEAKKSCPVE